MHALLEWLIAKAGRRSERPEKEKVVLSSHWFVVYDRAQLIVHFEPYRPHRSRRIQRRLTRRFPSPAYFVSTLITRHPVSSPIEDLHLNAIFDHFSDRIWETLADGSSHKP